MTRWNGKRFSIYDSEEKQVLGLIKELGNQTNFNTDSLERKTDLMGDHKGSWQGLSRPTLSDEGMRATVEKINDNDIPYMVNFLNDLACNIKDFKVVSDGLSDTTSELQEYINYCKKNNLICRIPNGRYNIRQIVLPSMIYDFGTDVIFYQNANVPCIVNEKIDMFGTGGKYQGINDLYLAEKNGDVDKIIINGGFEVKKATNFVNLLPGDQILYKGKRWIDSTYGYMGRFPINFCGLIDSDISQITIDFETSEANINLGFSIRTHLHHNHLNMGKDNNLQMFACMNCIGHNNSIKDGGGGLLVMQNCKNCIFISNTLTYLNPTNGVNSYMISIKNSIGCIVSNNIIDGYGDSNSIGIALTSQNGGCENTIVANNTILNCGCGIVNELCDNTTIIGNSLLNCGSIAGLGSIYNNKSYFVNIKDNNFKGNLSHVIVLNSGNYVTIKDNHIKDILSDKSGVIFLDNNTYTTDYKIENNTFFNFDGLESKGVWFATNSKILYRHYNILNNIFYNMLGGNIIRFGDDVTGYEEKEKTLKETIKIRNLSSPSILQNKGYFSVSKVGVGHYLLTFLTGTNRKAIIKSINAQYNGGYSIGDIKEHYLRIAYDDMANENHSLSTIEIQLICDNVLTDNPTTNSNASTQSNFGIDIDIIFEHDYTTW